jgi:Fe-S-cluster containining protein
VIEPNRFTETDSMSPELRQRIDAVYTEVDAAVQAASPKCDASGRCCRFAEYGHTLFLSHFEAEILLETAPAYQKPVTRDLCPFQVNNLCTARAERPLGCRIYFCDPAYEGVGETITEKALKQLKQLADEHETGWRYAPLHYFLNEAPDRPTATSPPNCDTTSSRIELPIL